MFRILAFLDIYFHSDEAASAIEYGLIAAAVALAIVTFLFSFGDQMGQMFQTLNEAIEQ